MAERTATVSVMGNLADRVDMACPPRGPVTRRPGWRGRYRKTCGDVCENLRGGSVMADTGIFRLKAVPQELQWWADRGWTGGIDFSRLAGLEQFVVRTRNTTYELTVLSPCSGEVLVRGGRFFPAYTRAHFAGSSLGGS